jgi:hypothetical protein
MTKTFKLETIEHAVEIGKTLSLSCLEVITDHMESLRLGYLEKNMMN